MFKLEKGKTPWLSKVWGNLDKNLAISGLIVSVILALWLSLSVGKYIEMAVLLFLACATYLLIVKRRSSGFESSSVTSPAKSSTYLILSIAFFVLFSYSMMAVALRPELYSRPLAYFIITALMAAVLAAEIFSLPAKKSYTYFLLFQIMLLSLSLRLTLQLLFPGVLGIDPWAHQMFTTNMLEAGHIPEGLSYSKLPIMHLIVGSSSLVTGLDYPHSTMLSLSLMQVITFVMFTFLLGRFLGNPRAGLLGALVLMMVPDVLAGGIFGPCPNGVGLIWVLPIIYVLFKARERRSITLICLSFLLMGVFILTHTLAALAMAILLFCFWIGFEIYKRAQRESFEVPISFYLAALFTVGMLSWWVYASELIQTFAEVIRWGLRVEMILPYYEAVGAYRLGIAYSEHLLNMLGFLLFYAFAIIGSLHMLSPATRHKHSFVIVLGGAVLVAIAFFSQSLGFIGVLPSRWFYFSQIIMAIPAALGLILVSTLSRNRLISRVLLVILILTVSFLMITNYRTNRDNPIYAENLTIRTAFTASELQGMNTVSDTWEGRVAVVQPDYYYLSFNKKVYTEELAPYLCSKDFSDCQEAMVIIRQEITSHPFASFGGILKLDYDLRQALEEQGFSCIYNCGAVSAFLFIR